MKDKPRPPTKQDYETKSCQEVYEQMVIWINSLNPMPSILNMIGIKTSASQNLGIIGLIISHT